MIFETIAKIQLMFPENLNIYWIVFFSVPFWYVAYYSPVVTSVYTLGDATYDMHVLCQMQLVFACMFNTLFSPSNFNYKAKPFHIWLGRISIPLGMWGYCMGLLICWWPTRSLPPTASSAVLSINGTLQVFCQIRLFLAIKTFQRLREELRKIAEGASTDMIKEIDDSQDEVHLRTWVDTLFGNDWTILLPCSSWNPQFSTIEQLKEAKDYALIDHIRYSISVFCLGCGVAGCPTILTNLQPTTALVIGWFLFLFAVNPYSNTFISRIRDVSEPTLLTPFGYDPFVRTKAKKDANQAEVAPSEVTALVS